MAIKLQPREQSFIGIAAILGVIIIGLFGIVWDFAVFPQWDKFAQAQQQLTTAKATEQSNDAQLAQLQQDKQTYDQIKAEMPEGKKIGEVDTAAGATMQSTKRDLLNTVIKMSQDDHNNVLISVKPLPKPKPPPQPVNPNPDPNAPPQLKLSDVVEEIPYEIKLRGNYESLNGFVNELAAFDTVVEINRVEISPDKAKDSLRDPNRPLEATFKINYLIKK